MQNTFVRLPHFVSTVHNHWSPFLAELVEDVLDTEMMKFCWLPRHIGSIKYLNNTANLDFPNFIGPNNINKIYFKLLGQSENVYWKEILLGQCASHDPTISRMTATPKSTHNGVLLQLVERNGISHTESENT